MSKWSAGAALAVGAPVIGLLAGAAAGGVFLSRAVIDEIGTANAPTVGPLVMNSTAPGGKTFRLTDARMAPEDS